MVVNELHNGECRIGKKKELFGDRSYVGMVRNLNKVTIQVTMRTWWFPFPYTGSLKSVPKFSSFTASQVLMMVGSGRARAAGGCV